MKRAHQVLKAGAFQWIALAVLIAAMFSASKRAAIPAIMAIVKFTWPLLIVWLVWRFIKVRVGGAVTKFQEQVMQAAQQGSTPRNVTDPGAFRQAAGPRRTAAAGGEVLDLCAKCGSLLTSGHRCS